jgi:hypothetical protein
MGTTTSSSTPDAPNSRILSSVYGLSHSTGPTCAHAAPRTATHVRPDHRVAPRKQKARQARPPSHPAHAAPCRAEMPSAQRSSGALRRRDKKRPPEDRLTAEASGRQRRNDGTRLGSGEQTQVECDVTWWEQTRVASGEWCWPWQVGQAAARGAAVRATAPWTGRRGCGRSGSRAGASDSSRR